MGCNVHNDQEHNLPPGSLSHKSVLEHELKINQPEQPPTLWKKSQTGKTNKGDPISIYKPKFFVLILPRHKFKSNQMEKTLKHFGKRRWTTYSFFCTGTMKHKKTRHCIFFFSPGTPLSLLVVSNNSRFYDKAICKPPLLVSIKNFIYATYLPSSRQLS